MKKIIILFAMLFQGLIVIAQNNSIILDKNLTLNKPHEKSTANKLVDIPFKQRLQAGGINIDISNANETIGVELIVSENTEQPALDCLHPIAYTAELGNLPNKGEFTLLFDFTFNTSDAYASRKPRPKSVKARPHEMGRPIGEDTVAVIWKEQFGSELGD